MMSTKQPSASQPRLTGLSVLRIFWKQKFLVAAIWVLGSAITFLVVRSLPPIYKAESLILVESQKIPERLVESTVNAELQDRLATINQQILSSTRLQKIIDKFNLYKDERKSSTQEEVVEQMRKDINIKLERGWTRNQPGAFRVSFQGPSPDLVAAVVNQIGNLFIEENLRAREVQAMGTSEFLETQLQQAKKNLEDQESKLSHWKMQHQGELPQQEQSLLQTLSNFNMKLQGNQDAINRAQQNKIMLENAVNLAEMSETTLGNAARERSAAQRVGTAQPAGSPDGSGRVAKGPAPKKKSEVLEAELEAMRTRYKDEHPLMKSIKTDIARLKRLEEKEAAAETPAKSDTQTATAPAKPAQPGQPAQSPATDPELVQVLLREHERSSSLKSQLAAASKELEDRQAEHQQILASIASYQERLDKLPIREQEMAAVKRDYEISKSNYESLLNKNLSAEMSADMEKRQKAERFTILDTARVPEKPFKPKRPLLNGVGCVVALFLGLGLAFGKELNRNVILGEWELPADITVLGRVPIIGAKTIESSSAAGSRKWPPLAFAGRRS